MNIHVHYLCSGTTVNCVHMNRHYYVQDDKCYFALFRNYYYVQRELLWCAHEQQFLVNTETITGKTVFQGAHWSGKSQGNLFFLQGQGKVREFCKMVREIRKSSKVREF